MIRIGRDDRELVTADADAHIGLTQSMANGGGDVLQHLVAGMVAVIVVDMLQTIDVDCEQ